MKRGLCKFIGLLIAALFVSSNLLFAESNEGSDIQINTYKKENIIPLLTTLQEWSVREFGKAPYFYAPPKENIVAPSDIFFVNGKDALIALAKKEDQVVGVISLIAFDALELQAQYFGQDTLGQVDLFHRIQKAGFDPSQILYVGYFLTAPECHNDHDVVQALYGACVDYAKQIGKTQICYMDDVGLPGAPPLNDLIEPWGTVINGFKSTGVQISHSWPTKDSDEVKEREHILEFYVKDL